MKIKLKKLSQKDIEEKKANYDIFVEVKEKKNVRKQRRCNISTSK